MVLAGKHGTWVLSVSIIPRTGVAPQLHKFWQIAEETAAEHGKSVDRQQWRLVLHVHLAESRKEAIEQAKVGAGYFQRDYFEHTLGHDQIIDGPADKIV